MNNAIKLLKEYQFVTASTICSFKKNTIGYEELNVMRKKVQKFLDRKEDKTTKDSNETIDIK